VDHGASRAFAALERGTGVDAVGSPQLLKALDAAHDGVSLQVVENTGTAGDVILLHPLVLHVATPNTSDAPRFLLSAGVDLPSMWAM
jgi:hypothetical protein